MAKSVYEQVLSDIKKTAKDKKSTRFSKSDFVNSATALLNSDDYEASIFIKDGTEAKEVKTQPVRKFREAMKPVLKKFGVDNAELDKIHDVEFPKAMGEALYDVSTEAIRGYMGTGRAFAFPMGSKDETQMSIAVTDVKEKSVETRMIKQKQDGSYESVPTGKSVTTKKHKALKASNKVPGWLKV